jgi:hypothetical protein
VANWRLFGFFRPKTTVVADPEPRREDGGARGGRGGEAAIEHCYVVAYVANPHDPGNERVDAVPNPMSAEADCVINLLGESALRVQNSARAEPKAGLTGAAH